MSTTAACEIVRGAEIGTWFGIGGRARRFARARSVEDVRALLAIDPELLVLGEGANLLVDDEGVDELVVSLRAGELSQHEFDARTGMVRVGAGAHLFELVNASVRAGMGGLENLAGIPATIGGALAMNAGGAFGEIGSLVERVFALSRDGKEQVIERAQCGFGYRASALRGFVITGAELRLTPGDPRTLAQRLKEVTQYKLSSQPMRAHSAGCCFKNPTLGVSIEGIGVLGQRVSAGLLIDRSGLKGTHVGGAMVSEQHANFIVVDKSVATARDVITLMERVEEGVRRAFGVGLEREVVVWSRYR
jgi:UDP-N-acetylmuramate dehydrogenase